MLSVLVERKKLTSLHLDTLFDTARKKKKIRKFVT